MTARRSDSTRAAILVAARERFAADGFERATIRAIAADARIDPSMVMRYYGNKEALFAAAADFDLRLPDLGDTPTERIGAALARHFLHRWEDDETLMALLRAAVTKEAAAERMRSVFAQQVGPVAARLAPDPAQAAVRAGLIATQMLGFALCRYILRLPPVVGLTPEEAVAWLGPAIQRYLTGDADSAEPKTGDANGAEPKTGDAGSPETKTGDVNSPEAKTGETDGADAETSETDSPETKTGDTDRAEAGTA